MNKYSTPAIASLTFVYLMFSLIGGVIAYFSYQDGDLFLTFVGVLLFIIGISAILFSPTIRDELHPAYSSNYPTSKVKYIPDPLDSWRELAELGVMPESFPPEIRELLQAEGWSMKTRIEIYDEMVAEGWDMSEVER